MSESLVPAPARAFAESRNRVPFGFGTRFFIALLLGLVWLAPMWWSPRFIAVMFLWDGFVFLAWALDLVRLPPPSKLEVQRLWTAPLELGRASEVNIEIRNRGRIAVHTSLVDSVPTALRSFPPTLDARVIGAEPRRLPYPALPRERGDTSLGDLFLRYRSSLGLAERWAVARLSQTVRVFPDLLQAKEQALFLIRSRQTEMEKRRRVPGIGREFESLRDYRDGDELRNVCWSATARRHQLVTRTYEAERSQTLWIVLDAGRLLRTLVQEPGRTVRLAKLDYAVNAALSVAQVASQMADRVGLLAYGRSIQQSIGPGRGQAHIRSLADSLARVRGEAIEANHGLAAKRLLAAQSRRALIVWITDFAETPATPEVIEYAAHISRRHLVVFAAVTQPDLGQLAQTVPKTTTDMFRHAAALEIVQRRELLLRRLQQNGVLAMELSPAGLVGSLVNEYLQIKDLSLL